MPGVLDTPADFSGWQGSVTDPSRLDTIRIGFFAPDRLDDPVGIPMRNAAILALDRVNREGGLHGVPFGLVRRWSYNPWGAGSKKMIRLVYEDSVWAVIGSLDGTSTHIAEQIVTKAWVPLLAPVSADPTLNYVRVPWMFRLPPGNEKQVSIIIRDGIRPLALQKVGVVSSTDHDGRTFASDLVPQLEKAGIPPVFHFEISSRDFDATGIVRRLRVFQPDGIILRLPREELLSLLARIREAAISVPVFLPWIPGVSPADLRSRARNDVYCVRPFDPAGNSAYHAFEAAYRARYGTTPLPVAAYTYDALQMLIRATRTSGLNRAKIRDAIAGMQDYEGVTGRIHWDNGWANLGKPVLRVVPGDSAAEIPGSPFPPRFPR